MATKLNTIAKGLIKQYKEEAPEAGFIVIETNTDLGWNTFKDLYKHAKKYKMKSFHVTDVIPLKDKEHPPIVWDVQPVKYKKNTLSYGGRQGTFKITFSDNTFMIASWFIAGFGRNTAIESLIATETETLYKLKKMLNRNRRKHSKPKTGFYKLLTIQGQLIYSKVEHPSLINTVHPAISQLEKDMKFFFKDITPFTNYGMPGVRKAMLIGPPGTGKTSMCIKIAREYSTTHCVSVCTDIESAAAHLQKCAKFNVSTLLIIEDAEAALSGDYGNGASSEVLNFLDGINQPTNKAGTYVIMTTNFPNKIENRILKRPGRIDRIYQVGPLEAEYALECAKIYFDKDIKYTKSNKDKLISIVNGMTGAQIRELANSTRAYCASEQITMSIKAIYTVSKQLTEDLSDAIKFAEDNSLMVEKQSGKIGFGLAGDTTPIWLDD